MSEDFRQEKRWKIATAFVLSQWCQQWHKSDAQGRRRLQTKCWKPEERSVEQLMQVGADIRAKWEQAVSAEPADVLMEEASQEPVAEPTGEVKPDQGSSEQVLTPTSACPPSASAPINPRSNLPPHLRDPLMELQPSLCASSILTYVDVPHATSATEEVYGPPRPDVDDAVYEDELLSLDRVVPVSRFMSTRVRYTDVRWDVWGRDLTKPENQDMMHKLRQEEPLISPYAKPSDGGGPFGLKKREERDARPAEIPHSIPRPKDGAVKPQWHPDEDDLLLSYGKAYQHNWPLVAEWLASNRVVRTPWECYERYKQLEVEGRPRRTPKLDPRRQMEKHRNTFEYVRRVVKRREPKPLRTCYHGGD
jgi:hypothetical protein